MSAHGFHVVIKEKSSVTRNGGHTVFLPVTSWGNKNQKYYRLNRNILHVFFKKL